MTVSNELKDRLLANYKKPEGLIGENGLLKQLTKRLVERALEAKWLSTLGMTKISLSPIRKVTKNRGWLPSDEALLKLFYLALNNIAKRLTMPVQNWKPVLNQFTIQFRERIPTN